MKFIRLALLLSAAGVASCEVTAAPACLAEGDIRVRIGSIEYDVDRSLDPSIDDGKPAGRSLLSCRPAQPLEPQYELFIHGRDLRAALGEDERYARLSDLSKLEIRAPGRSGPPIDLQIQVDDHTWRAAQTNRSFYVGLAPGPVGDADFVMRCHNAAPQLDESAVCNAKLPLTDGNHAFFSVMMRDIASAEVRPLLSEIQLFVSELAATDTSGT